MYDVIQISGSLLILIAFVFSVLGKLQQTSLQYLVANAVGSAMLAGTAIVSREWGFILLEGIWAIVSVASIIRKASRGPVPSD